MTSVYKVPGRPRYAAKRKILGLEKIIVAALEFSELYGYLNLSPKKLSELSNIPRSNIHHYFGSMSELHGAIITEAIQRNHYIIIAQGVTCGQPIALAAPPELIIKSLEKTLRCQYMNAQMR